MSWTRIRSTFSTTRVPRPWPVPSSARSSRCWWLRRSRRSSSTQQLKSEFPLVIRFAAKPKQFSPNGDRYRDSTQVGFDLSEPAKVTFSILDGEGNEVRRLVDDRQLAGDAKHRFRWDGRDDDGERRARRRLPDAGGAARRGARDRLVQADPRGPPAAAGAAGIRDAERDRAARAGAVARGDDSLPRARTTRRRSSASSAPTTPPSRTWCAASAARAAAGVWHGEVATGPRAHRARARRRLRVHGERARQGRQPRRGARRAIPRAGLARPGTGVSVRSFTLRGPARAWWRPARWRRSRSGPSTAAVDFVALAPRRPEADPARRSDRRAPPCGNPARTPRPALYVVRVRAGRQRAVWPIAVAGLPQSKRAARAPAPAGGAAGDLVAGAERRGRRLRRLRGLVPEGALARPRPARSPAAGCRRASRRRWRRCCATSIASGSPTT